MKKFVFTLFSLLPLLSLGQKITIPLTDLNDFHTQKNNWSIVGDVSANLTDKTIKTTSVGEGVLLCRHENMGEYGEEYDLFTRQEFGDMDLSLEFMLSRGSNSGVYLQSRYEIQLNDSWGVKTPKYFDCGGIYQRRDLSKPEGQNQYEGYAPRYNTYKAPGLWNKMEVSYKAPRFDPSGKKISNATIIYVKLNGTIIHENVELSGPTGGAVSENEVAFAPLRFQGDHGAVAFRNIEILNYDKSPGSVSDLSYRTYYGVYPSNADMSKIKINEQDKTDILSWEVTRELNDYVYFIEGTYNAPTTGEYTFELHNPGNSSFTIDGKEIMADQWTGGGNRVASVFLNAGNHKFEIFSNKRDGWLRPALGLWSAGPGFRLTPHHAPQSVITSSPTDPIILHANNNVVLRSFMDWKKQPDEPNYRMTHAVSVGSPSNLHYTYDLETGALAQVWKGDFLDTTPMWHDRGDGSSKPLGSLTLLDHEFLLRNMENTDKGIQLKQLGYDIDDNDLPTFRYKANNSIVTDKIRVKDGKALERQVGLSDNSGIILRLVNGDKVEQIDSGLYAVNDKKYYIQIDDNSRVMLINGNELLAAPQGNSIRYSIIF